MSARILALGLSSLLAAGTPAAKAQNRVPLMSRRLVRLSFTPLANKVALAVVKIYSRRVLHTSSPSVDPQFFRRFFGNQPPFGLPRPDAATAPLGDRH